jgi:hypothetical protein
MALVYIQDGNGRTTTGRQPVQHGTVPAKMAIPRLTTWIEKHRNSSRHVVYATQIAGFRQIAVVA